MITIVKENLICGSYCEIIDGTPRYCILGTVFHALNVPDDVLIEGDSGPVASHLPVGLREKFFTISEGAAATILRAATQRIADLNDGGNFEDAFYALREMGVECELVEKEAKS